MHKELERKSKAALERIAKSGITLSVVGTNSLRITGEINADQKEFIRLWKRQLIDELLPKCSECSLPLQLDSSDNLWFCPIGCGLGSNNNEKTIAVNV